nr:CDP-glycerol glycerophosphotransferase family protein [Paenibacillus sp. SYP-B3998]
MDWLVQAVRQLPILVLIKPHPDDTGAYDRFINERIRMVPESFHLQEVLQASDLILTISSTTGVEAAMLNRGVVVLQPDMPYDYHLNYNGYARHLAKAEAGAVVSSSSELTECLRRWLEEESFRSELQKKGGVFKDLTLNPDEPQPGFRVYQLIQQLLHSSGKERS